MDSPCNPFYYKNGKLYCEKVEIHELVRSLVGKTSSVSLLNDDVEDVIHSQEEHITFTHPVTPVYVYSLAKIRSNVQCYKDGLVGATLDGDIGFALKANFNPTLVRLLKTFGVKMIITVSAFEMMAAMKCGFSPGNIIFNGNGKQEWEIRMALELGVLLNVDSVFDAKQITEIAKSVLLQKKNWEGANVFLRIRPLPSDNAEAALGVHDYVNTAESSKFGFQMSELNEIVDALKSCEKIKIIGIHCHFGSGILNSSVYAWLGQTIQNIFTELSRRNIDIRIVNIGGGIGIDYTALPHGFQEFMADQPQGIVKSYTDIKQLEATQQSPDILKFLLILRTTLPSSVKLILEPGRSLVGDAGILVTKVLGVKPGKERKFMVVDGSMTEVIRPCLYGSVHQIMPTSLNPLDKWQPFDVVGPVCESSDFLGKNIPLQEKADYLAVMDCGAYCSSMASNYNLRPRVAEILVDEKNWRFIRQREEFEDLMHKY